VLLLLLLDTNSALAKESKQRHDRDTMNESLMKDTLDFKRFSWTTVSHRYIITVDGRWKLWLEVEDE
jgi:hypothetical protein